MSDHVVKVIEELATQGHGTLIALPVIKMESSGSFAPDPVDKLGVRAILHQVFA